MASPSQAPAQQQYILIKQQPGWSLPSLSPACTQVEAYLRLAGIPFAVQECEAASASATGQLPALDSADDLVAGKGGTTPADEWAAARSLLEYLRHKVVNLDRGLSSAQKAESLAFTALVESRLQPALLFTTWLEPQAYSNFTRVEYGASQPFPLSHILPRNQRAAVQRALGSVTAAQVYADGSAALEALAARLSASPGPYFFGDRPASIDALLFAVLSFLKAAPVVHPELRHKVERNRSLDDYVSRLAAAHFTASVPSAEEATGVEWTSFSESGVPKNDQGKYSKVQSEREREMQRKGRIWLACASAAIVAYVAFSGQYFGFLDYDDYEDMEEDE